MTRHRRRRERNFAYRKTNCNKRFVAKFILLNSQNRRFVRSVLPGIFFDLKTPSPQQKKKSLKTAPLLRRKTIVKKFLRTPHEKRVLENEKPRTAIVVVVKCRVCSWKSTRAEKQYKQLDIK